MKHKHKLTALLLCLVMLLGLLAACGSQAPASSAAESASGIQASAEEATETAPEEAPEAETGEPEASAEDSAAEEAAEPEEDSELFTWGQISFHPTEIALPLTEEDVTLSLWTDFLPPLFAAMNGMEDNSVYIELEKRTGVDLDITSVAITDASTQASLLVASGDFPNLWYGFVNYYGGTVDSAVDDEIVYNLADYKDSMPNYFAMIDENEELRKDTYTDSGVMAQTYGVFADPKSTQGLALRKDWLEAQGLDVPVTYDDYYEVLTSFKNNYDAVYWMNANGEQYFSAGYDIVPGFMVRDGKVEYGFMEDAYLDYLTMMNKWYSEGLINDLFLTNPYQSLLDFNAVLNNEAGAWYCTAAQMMPWLISSAVDPNFHITGLTAVTKDGSQAHIGEEGSVFDSQMWSITTVCEDPDVIAKYVDYVYSDDGILLANYGVEGETFTYVDGVPKLTDLVLNNPNYSYGAAMNIFVCDRMTPAPFVIDENRVRADYIQDQLDAIEVWNNSNDGLYNIPRAGVSMNVDESQEYTDLYADIETYQDENIVKFVVGDKSLDEFDDFVATLKQMGIERCVELEQAAYDRYLES